MNFSEILEKARASLANSWWRATAFAVFAVVIVLIGWWSFSGFSLSFFRSNASPALSCGASGGNYCSPVANACPIGYSSLGPSNDCATCCSNVITSATPAVPTPNPRYPTTWPSCLVWNSNNTDAYNWASVNAIGNPSNLVTQMYPTQTTVSFKGNVVYNNCPSTVHLSFLSGGSVQAGGDPGGTNAATGGAFNRLLPQPDANFASCWNHPVDQPDPPGCKGPFQVDYDSTYFTCGRVFGSAMWTTAGASPGSGGGAAVVFNYGYDCTGAPGEKTIGRTPGTSTGNVCFDNCFANVAPGNGSFCTAYCATGGAGTGGGPGTACYDNCYATIAPGNGSYCTAYCATSGTGTGGGTTGAGGARLSGTCTATGNLLNWTLPTGASFNYLFRESGNITTGGLGTGSNRVQLVTGTINDTNLTQYNVRTFTDTSAGGQTVTYYIKSAPPNTSASNLFVCPDDGRNCFRDCYTNVTPGNGSYCTAYCANPPTSPIPTITTTTIPTTTTVPTTGPSGPTTVPTTTTTTIPTTSIIPTPIATPATTTVASTPSGPTTSTTTVPTITMVPTTGPGGPTTVPSATTTTIVSTVYPTIIQSSYPTTVPSNTTTVVPTITYVPTTGPTTAPGGGPTTGPTTVPSMTTTVIPTITYVPTTGPGPSGIPTTIPTVTLTTIPTTTYLPTTGPTTAPGGGPTTGPTTVPTTTVTTVPTITYIPTVAPTTGPTTVPTIILTMIPTTTYVPTIGPTLDPSGGQSIGPTTIPTTTVTTIPTITYIPTTGPTSLPIPTGPNVVPNPSLDNTNGSSPSGWTQSTQGINNATFTYPVIGQSGNGAQVTVSSYTSGYAAWSFPPVPVTPGTQYTYTDSYISNVPSTLVVRYTMADGSTVDIPLLTNIPPSATWQNVTATFTIPAGAVSATVLHELTSVGTLTVDNVSMTPTSGGTVSAGPNLIGNPTLNTANGSAPAGWQADSQGNNAAVFNYPVAGASGNAAQVQVTSYTDGYAAWRFDAVAVTGGAQYTYSESYMASVPTRVVARYTMADGSIQDVVLNGNVPAANSWTPLSLTFTAPAGAVSVTIMHELTAVGTLSIDSVSLNRAGAVGSVGGVKTGAGETTVLAFLVAALVSLAYVSYTHSPIARKREAEKISKDPGPLDFRS